MPVKRPVKPVKITAALKKVGKEIAGKEDPTVESLAAVSAHVQKRRKAIQDAAKADSKPKPSKNKK